MSKRPAIPSNVSGPKLFVPSAEDKLLADTTEQRAKALRQWMHSLNRSSYDPAELPSHISQPSNELLSHAERVRFVTEPLAYGKTYVAYFNAPHITTWTGETLALCYTWDARKVRDSYVTNERGSFWAKGIDGRIYYGRHNGKGMYCTMRLAKHQS